MKFIHSNTESERREECEEAKDSSDKRVRDREESVIMSLRRERERVKIPEREFIRLPLLPCLLSLTASTSRSLMNVNIRVIESQQREGEREGGEEGG